MTNKEVFDTILSYWQDSHTSNSKSLDEALQTMKTSDSIYDALLGYTHLCMRAGKDVQM